MVKQDEEKEKAQTARQGSFLEDRELESPIGDAAEQELGERYGCVD
jgi:hypothetical protein